MVLMTKLRKMRAVDESVEEIDFSPLKEKGIDYEIDGNNVKVYASHEEFMEAMGRDADSCVDYQINFDECESKIDEEAEINTAVIEKLSYAYGISEKIARNSIIATSKNGKLALTENDKGDKIVVILNRFNGTSEEFKDMYEEKVYDTVRKEFSKHIDRNERFFVKAVYTVDVLECYLDGRSEIYPKSVIAYSNTPREKKGGHVDLVQYADAHNRKMKDVAELIAVETGVDSSKIIKSLLMISKNSDLALLQTDVRGGKIIYVLDKFNGTSQEFKDLYVTKKKKIVESEFYRHINRGEEFLVRSIYAPYILRDSLGRRSNDVILEKGDEDDKVINAITKSDYKSAKNLDRDTFLEFSSSDTSTKFVVGIMKKLGLMPLKGEVGTYYYNNGDLVVFFGLYDEDGDGNLELAIDKAIPINSKITESKLKIAEKEIIARAKKANLI